jgi:hypothetical protein
VSSARRFLLPTFFVPNRTKFFANQKADAADTATVGKTALSSSALVHKSLHAGSGFKEFENSLEPMSAPSFEPASTCYTRAIVRSCAFRPISNTPDAVCNREVAMHNHDGDDIQAARVGNHPYWKRQETHHFESHLALLEVQAEFDGSPCADEFCSAGFYPGEDAGMLGLTTPTHDLKRSS